MKLGKINTNFRGENSKLGINQKLNIINCMISNFNLCLLISYSKF